MREMASHSSKGEVATEVVLLLFESNSLLISLSEKHLQAFHVFLLLLQ